MDDLEREARGTEIPPEPEARGPGSAGTLFGFSGSSLRALGLACLVIGFLLWMGGFFLWVSFTPPSIFNTDIGTIEAATQAAFLRTAIMVFIGFLFIAIGGYAFRFGMVRPVTTYVATEAAPAIGIASEAVARGVSEAFASSGGVPVRIQGSAVSGSSGIRIKCRNCGYLETEDAEYCSKCGKPL